MSWYAKPSGSYAWGSTEADQNTSNIADILTTNGCTIEVCSGVIGNVRGESGLNPWRWQSDRFNLSNGYGLYQYTPASGYINNAIAQANPYYAPNKSTITQTSGAMPHDGACQTQVMIDNSLGKWVNTCWRSYWSTSTYSSIYTDTRYILNTWGDGSRISIGQFKSINDVYYATLCFLACFEGPRVPNITVRYNMATEVYQYLTGSPVPPTPPGPTPGTLTFPALKMIYTTKLL